MNQLDTPVPTKVQYAVWEIDGEVGYWLLFDSLADAVSDQGDGVEVHRMEAKLLGKFKRSVKTVKVKTRKKSRK